MANCRWWVLCLATSMNGEVVQWNRAAPIGSVLSDARWCKMIDPCSRSKDTW